MAWLLWLHFISLSETKALNSFQNQQSGLQQATEHWTYRNPSRCYRAKEKCIAIIPSDIRVTFLSLLLHPPLLQPQLSGIQVDSNHWALLCFACGSCVKRTKVSIKARGGREDELYDWSALAKLPCLVLISAL